jgi:DNA-binding LacI/PurR family transcriptional regulator
LKAIAQLGYRNAMALAIVGIEQGSCASLAKHVRGELGAAAKSEALAKGLRFGAVAAASDELALGYGCVPGDMTVVGFGDLAGMGFSYPAKSTVVRDAAAIVRAVGDFFRAREGGARPGKRRVVPANRVLRQSA